MRHVPRIAGAAGVLSVLALWTGIVVAGALRPGYDHVRQYVTELGSGPDGWVVNLAFVVAGGLATLFALGLARAGLGRWGPLLLAARALALVGDGVVPGDPDVARRTASGMVHNALVVVAVLCFVAASIVLARRFGGDPRWRYLARWSVASGLAVLALFLAQAVFTPQGLGVGGAPLAPWAGAIQRTSLAVASIWMVLVALRLPAQEVRPDRVPA
jgi:hypothetical membrane protein